MIKMVMTMMTLISMVMTIMTITVKSSLPVYGQTNILTWISTSPKLATQLIFGTIFSSTYRNLETWGVYHDIDANADAHEDNDNDDDGHDDETCQGEPQFQFDPTQLQHLPDWDNFDHYDEMIITGNNCEAWMINLLFISVNAVCWKTHWPDVPTSTKKAFN